MQMAVTHHARWQPVPRQGKVRVTDGQCLQTTNHTLFYKLNRVVQRGQLEMHSLVS